MPVPPVDSLCRAYTHARKMFGVSYETPPKNFWGSAAIIRSMVLDPPTVPQQSVYGGAKALSLMVMLCSVLSSRQPLPFGGKASWPQGFRWYVVACGSRRSVFDAFGIALKQHHDAFNVLLVDGEGPVTLSPWEHLQARDHWSIQGIPDNHCHLMVQIMEAWIIADLETLSRFYGQRFNAYSIPGQDDVESISKADLERALIQATRNTQKGEYHKIRHGPKIFALVDVNKIRNRARHCNRMFTTLSNKIGET